MQVVLEPTQQEYNITAKVKFVDVNVKDHDRQYSRRLVILIPQESMQRDLFFNAWLPEVSEEYFELATVIRSSIPSPCRMAILKAKKGISDRPYLTIMSKGVEEDFISHKMEGKIVEVKILPEDQDHVSDDARDSGGNFDLIHGQETL